jgi:hypothetical protein
MPPPPSYGTPQQAPRPQNAYPNLATSYNQPPTQTAPPNAILTDSVTISVFASDDDELSENTWGDLVARRKVGNKTELEIMIDNIKIADHTF